MSDFSKSLTPNVITVILGFISLSLVSMTFLSAVSLVVKLVPRSNSTCCMIGSIGSISQDNCISSKFIDPDGIVAEGAYDLGVLMREWIDELIADPVRLGRERCAYLSSLTGMETQAMWQWGFIQSMSTGLFLIQVGLEQSGVQMLKVPRHGLRHDLIGS